MTDKEQEIIHKLMAQLLRKDWFGLLMMVCYWSVVFFGEGKVVFNELARLNGLDFEFNKELS